MRNQDFLGTDEKHRKRHASHSLRANLLYAYVLFLNLLPKFGFLFVKLFHLFGCQLKSLLPSATFQILRHFGGELQIIFKVFDVNLVCLRVDIRSFNALFGGGGFWSSVA